MDSFPPRAPKSDNAQVSPKDLEADMVVGDFRIKKRLGAGGMGVVYRAWQVSLNRLVALKLLGSPVQSAAGMARFRREAQAIAKLNHPGIVRVYFIGQDDQLCYMALEYVEGISFREVLRRLRSAPADTSSLDDALHSTRVEASPSAIVRFDAPDNAEPESTESIDDADKLSASTCQLIEQKTYVRRCVELVRDAALSLAHAHVHGVIHRDIKPENLLLSKDGKVYVIDFGLARLYEDETITYTGQLMGTPLYMSPEQVMGQKKIDGRTDIYSLAMVLYELLTLEPPHKAPNRESLFRQIVTRALPPVAWHNSAVPDDLTAIVHQSLAKDADERYATMGGLAADLDRFLVEEPVLARPYRYRIDEREIVAQRPNIVVYLAFICFAGGLLLLLVAVVIAAVSFESMGQIRREELGRIIVIAVAFGCLCMAITMLFAARAMLNGRPWARWSGLTFGVLFSILAVSFAVGAYVSIDVLHRRSLAFYSVVCAPLGFIFVVVLAYPSVARWFRFAAEARAEFQRQKQGARQRGRAKEKGSPTT